MNTLNTEKTGLYAMHRIIDNRRHIQAMTLFKVQDLGKYYTVELTFYRIKYIHQS